MDTRNSIFYKNKRVVAESVVPTSHLVFPKSCKNSVKQSDFSLIILEVILSILFNKAFTKSLNWGEVEFRLIHLYVCSMGTSWFSGLVKQTKFGQFSLAFQSWRWWRVHTHPVFHCTECTVGCCAHLFLTWKPPSRFITGAYSHGQSRIVTTFGGWGVGRSFTGHRRSPAQSVTFTDVWGLSENYSRAHLLMA